MLTLFPLIPQLSCRGYLKPVTTTHLQPLIHFSLITDPISSLIMTPTGLYYPLHCFTIILLITIACRSSWTCLIPHVQQSLRDHRSHPIYLQLSNFFLVVHSTIPSLINEHTPAPVSMLTKTLLSAPTDSPVTRPSDLHYSHATYPPPPLNSPLATLRISHHYLNVHVPIGTTGPHSRRLRRYLDPWAPTLTPPSTPAQRFPSKDKPWVWSPPGTRRPDYAAAARKANFSPSLVGGTEQVCLNRLGLDPHPPHPRAYLSFRSGEKGDEGDRSVSSPSRGESADRPEVARLIQFVFSVNPNACRACLRAPTAWGACHRGTRRLRRDAGPTWTYDVSPVILCRRSRSRGLPFPACNGQDPSRWNRAPGRRNVARLKNGLFCSKAKIALLPAPRVFGPSGSLGTTFPKMQRARRHPFLLGVARGEVTARVANVRVRKVR